MNRFFKILAVLLCVPLIASGCAGAEETKEQLHSEYLTLGEYKGLVLEDIVAEVSDEELDEMLEYIISQYGGPEQITDRPVDYGDTVNINYKGLLNGVAFAGGTADNQDLGIGTGQFIDGFEDGLVGFMPGTQVDLPLTFPEVYHSEELAGQDVIFEVYINYIHGDLIIPELNDEWVSEYSDYQTVAEYRESIKTEMLAQKQTNIEWEKQEKLVKTVLDNATIISIPQERIDRGVEDELNAYATSTGMTVDELLVVNGTTKEQFAEQMKPYLEEYLRNVMVFEAIAEIEGITLSDEEKDTLAADYGFTSYSEFAGAYGERMVNEVLLMGKVEDFLVENNEFKPA